MTFKIDQNLPSECARLFSGAGLAADSVAEEFLSGAEDNVLIARCLSEKRVLVTLDMDFANIRAYPPGSHAGIVVLRPKSQDKETLLLFLTRILPVLSQRSPEGQLWIAERNRIRIRETSTKS